MDDLISRQAAIEALQEHRNLFCDNTPDTFSVLPYGDKCRVDELDMAIATLINLPSAQPEQTNSWCINSWCNNCKEYDKEKHSCPRFNRVIKQTLDEVYAHAETEAEARFHAQQRWIPCSERLPEVKQIVLKSCREFGWNGTEYLSVSIGIYDTNDGNIVAWMPLPKPYRAERRTDEADYRKE